MNWLTLPKEIWLLIAEWSDIRDRKTLDLYHSNNRPEIYSLYASCKSFKWLSDYLYTFVREVLGYYAIHTVDIFGREQGCNYVFHVNIAVVLEGIGKNVDNKPVGEYAYPQHFDGKYWYTVNGKERRYHSDSCTGVTYYGEKCDCPKRKLSLIEAQVKANDPLMWTLWYKTYIYCKKMTIMWKKLKPEYKKKIIVRSAEEIKLMADSIDIKFD